MKKIVFLVIVLLLSVGFLFASAADEQIEASEGGLLPPAEKTQIDMIGWRFPVTEFYAEELESMNEIKNLTVNTQMMDSSGAKEQMRLTLLSGAGVSPYEILHLDGSFIVELGLENKLLPLNDLIEKYKDEYDLGDISEGLWEMASIDGVIYGVPIDANSMNFFYNMDLFEKYDLQVPDTYDEIIAISQILKQEESIDLPFTINVHSGSSWRTEFRNMLWAFGLPLLNPDGTVAFNNQTGIDALKMLERIVKETMGQEGATWSIDDTEIGLETGRLAMAVTWTSRAPNMDNPEKSKLVGKIGFAPAPRAFPGGRRSAPKSGDFYGIPANTDVDPELIFKIICEVSDLETQMRGADYGMMTRNQVINERTDIRYLDAALTSIDEGGAVSPDLPGLRLLYATIQNYVPKIMDPEYSAENIIAIVSEIYTKEAKEQGYID
ncbi:MAG: extracellular solute-binding protein [Spirochaetia bacterium]|nr:extracellular solute-binding protein [Spirochaetia bacterium]